MATAGIEKAFCDKEFSEPNIQRTDKAAEIDKMTTTAMEKLRSCNGHFTLMSSETGTCVSVAHARAHIDAHIDLEFFLNAEPQEVKDKCHDSSCSDHDDR